MLITDDKFYCEILDKSICELKNRDLVYKNKGIGAAKKQIADYLRASLRPEDYFNIPYYERENSWALASEDFKHYHAPCLQYAGHDKQWRTVTALSPNNGVVAVECVNASSEIDDTKITLTVLGKTVVVNEKDYIAEDNEEAFCPQVD